ncbi:cytochrome c1 [Micavibrio aeruginosavorus]|uniref:cytochrome c1 n=1 Tax=Micavibrio aeruginosavorus TaxID=349221 RepID=UPI003F4A9730
MMRKTFILAGFAALMMSVSVPALAETETAPAADAAATEEHAAAPAGEDHAEEGGGHGHVDLPKVDWSSNGIFGTYDRASLQRGFQVYREVCSACHGMDRLSYRDLAALGYSEGEIKAIAASYMITDGPNEDGEMFERAGRPSDRFKNPYPNENAAKSVNNGALPADLSLVAKARKGGPDYIHALLTGYTQAPAGKELLPGQHWNKYMSGNVIAMPAPLIDGQVAYEDTNTPQTVDQYAKDVSHFLEWAAEPKMEVRKQTGLKAFLFLLVFTGVAYAVKRKIWSSLH